MKMKLLESTEADHMHLDASRQLAKPQLTISGNSLSTALQPLTGHHLDKINFGILSFD